MEQQFEDLQKTLETKGAKCKLQFTTKEQLFFESKCGFTDEELDIFRFRNRGYNVVQISFLMQEKYSKYSPGDLYSVSKVESRIRSIKKKMLKVLKAF